MTDDIVTRLMREAQRPAMREVCTAAAEEIERLRAVVRESSWTSCGFPHHFIGSADCTFSLATYVADGRYLVSTVGDYRPRGGHSDPVPLGIDAGDQFETMVFTTDPSRLNDDGEPTVTSWSELYMMRYRTAAEANRGHLETCRLFDRRTGTHQLENSSEMIAGVHSPDLCEGEHCTIHNMSDHHMRVWPQHWRGDRGIMERICPHGVGHPDPDERAGISTIHGCDGCCAPPAGSLY